MYESIDEDLVKRAALNTRRSAGPAGLDTDGWRRIWASDSYGAVNINLRKAFTNFIKKICLKKIEILLNPSKHQ